MKRIVFVLVLAVLAVPAPAAAKEVAGVEVCGSDGCNSLGGPGSNLTNFPTGGDPAPGVGPAPYYTVRFQMMAEGETMDGWQAFYVPSAKLMASEGENGGTQWMATDAAALDKAAAGIKPFSSPEIKEVLIGSRRVTENPQSYLRLFTVKSTGDAVPQGLADWEPIIFRGERETPWTMPQSGMFFSPSNGILQRGIEMVELPGGMSADIRAGDSLTGGGSSFPWRPVFFAILAAVALLIAASMIRPLRRRVFVRRAPTTA